MQVQSFMENIRNSIEIFKNRFVSLGRNIIDNIKDNVAEKFWFNLLSFL